MISISTLTYDLNGSLHLGWSHKSDVDTRLRRVSRTATLDGGAVIADMGFTDADRTLRLVASDITKEQLDRAVYLQRNYALLMFALAEGVFLGAIQTLSTKGSDLLLTVLVKEKLTE